MFMVIPAKYLSVQCRHEPILTIAVPARWKQSKDTANGEICHNFLHLFLSAEGTLFWQHSSQNDHFDMSTCIENSSCLYFNMYHSRSN